jgi:hypothetical protein
VVKLVVLVVTNKSTLTYTNCSKTCHLVETYHNKKREVSIVPIVTIKSIELIVRIKTQHVKSGKILICYPYIML